MQLIAKKGSVTISELTRDYDQESREQTILFLRRLFKYGIIVINERTELQSLPEIRFVSNDSPKGLEWLVTGKCNADCIYCIYQKYKKEIDELNTQEASKLIQSISEIGTINVTISGGEPFLRRDLFELINEMRMRNIFVTIITNGSRLNMRVARFLKKNDVKIKLSLDSMNPRVHDYLRGVQGLWEKASAGLNLLLKEEVETEVNTVITRHNFFELQQFYEKVVRSNIKRWNISIVRPMGAAANKWYDIYPDIMNNYWYVEQLVKQFMNEEKIEITFLFDFKFVKKYLQKRIRKKAANITTNCMLELSNNSMLTISPKGDVYICPYLQFTRLGNIRERSLKDLWINSKFHQPLLDIGKKRMDTICKKCQHLLLCRGGCIAHVLSLKGNICACDPVGLERSHLFERIFYKPAEHLQGS